MFLSINCSPIVVSYSSTPDICYQTLADHFSQEKIRFVSNWKPKQSEIFCESDVFYAIQERYLEIAKLYLDIPVSNDLDLNQEISFLKKRQNLQFCEAKRFFVHELITPCILENDMKIRKDAIADYVVCNQSDDVIAIIKIQPGSSLTTESVIDFMEKLPNVHHRAPDYLFGMITDGFHYLFIVLTNDGIFELQCKGNTVHCHQLDKWLNLKTVTVIFNSLLSLQTGGYSLFFLDHICLNTMPDLSVNLPTDFSVLMGFSRTIGRKLWFYGLPSPPLENPTPATRTC